MPRRLLPGEERHITKSISIEESYYRALENYCFNHMPKLYISGIIRELITQFIKKNKIEVKKYEK